MIAEKTVPLLSIYAPTMTDKPDTPVRDIYADFHALAEEYFAPESRQAIFEAFDYARGALQGMTRYDGSDMFSHSVGAAMIVISEIGLGRNSTISTLLHDPVRMGMITPEQAGERFGAQTVDILRGLFNISGVNTKQSEAQADNFRDLIVSYSTDPRVILIKLADRLEVMRSLSIFPEAKRRKKAWESLHLYAQIAHKLGLYSIKSELEDIALGTLEPADYSLIKHKLEDTAGEREQFIARFLAPIEEKMRAAGMKYTIKSRTKSIFSIWSKMRRQRIPFEEVYDIFALRIIIDTPREQEKTACWSAYSFVTDFYTPNPERMRDWISIPKSNGYESLHATVVTKEGRWVEIQIRSERMDAVAERGIAAHWRYKGVNQGGMGSEEWLGRLRELMETTDASKIAENFEGKLSSKEIFVFTPSGDLRKLPEGATVLDFAFDIHTSLGGQCTGGRIGGRNVPIKEQLRNGDIVEILTSKNQHPKADWLAFVATGKARSKIRAYLREQSARESSLGREELERKIRNWKIDASIDEAVPMLCKHYKCKTGTELYSRIASGAIDLAQIKQVLLAEEPGPIIPPPRTVAPKEAEVRGEALIIDEGLSGLEYKLARCCNPIFGDEVFAFVTVTAGITIHRVDCPNARRLREQFPYRVLDARWRSATAAGGFLVSINVTADDVTGMINRITEVISGELRLGIRSMNISSSKGTLQGVINVEVSNTSGVDTLIHSIMRIKGVQKAFRLNK